MSEILYTLIVTHITILCVTLYLHRSMAHRGVTFHPVVSHFMRFWLWLTTGMVTRQWVAIHRKHHRFTDRPGDPHSPHVFGIWTVLFKGVMLYHTAIKDRAVIDSYGKGIQEDFIERNLYTRFSRYGIILMLILDVLFFGFSGILVWIVQMAWIPFWAAAVVNGLCHWFGYRNENTKDESKNLFPWGIIVGGEELHNNHHISPGNPSMKIRSWEIDEGWFWIKVLEKCKLAKINYVQK
jgi:stearoyl-CoA desaturase (delta-9 desaturase)